MFRLSLDLHDQFIIDDYTYQKFFSFFLNYERMFFLHTEIQIFGILLF